MTRLWQKTRNNVNSFLYWLGPTYCIVIGVLILFCSFIIQLITSIGVPYIMINFFRFDLNNFTFVTLGMWAACSGRGAIIFPPKYSSLNQPEAFNCPPASWGWKTTQFSGITSQFFHHTLPKALILHPISCIFTFLAIVAALATIRRKKSYIALPIFSGLACLFAFLSFAIDLATFVPARHKLLSAEATRLLGAIVTSTSFGPAFWLSLTCFALDVLGNSMVFFGYGIWRFQRTDRTQRSAAYGDDVELKGAEHSRRGYAKQGSVTSFGEEGSSGSKSSRTRRGYDEKEEQEEEVVEEHIRDESATESDRRSVRTPTPAARRSGDGRSLADTTSVAPSRYEDAESEDEEGGSARSVYEDASPNVAHVGSRGFARRKPVQGY